MNEEREYLKISCFICCCKKRYISNGPNENDWVFFFFVVKEVFCQPVERFWMRKENHLRRLISTLIQTLPAAFVANSALSIRKLNRFFFFTSKSYTYALMKNTKEKKTTKKLFANEIYITSFVIRLFHLSGISWDRHENEANPFKVVICEKIKILIQNHLVEDLMN